MKKKITIFIILVILGMIASPVQITKADGDVIPHADYIKIISPYNNQNLCIGTKVMVRFNSSYNMLNGPIVIELSKNDNPTSNIDWIELNYTLQIDSVLKGKYNFEILDFGLPLSRKLRVRSSNRAVEDIVNVKLSYEPVLNHAKWVDNSSTDGNDSRKPLIFVHGIGLSFIKNGFSIHLKPEEASWDKLLTYLDSNGLFNTYKPYIFMYDSNDTDETKPNVDSDGVYQVSHKLANAINNDPILRSKNLTFIAHSMGGLVTRSLMAFWSINNKPAGEVIDKVITLFTPHRGSPLTNFPPNNVYSLTKLETNSLFINDISWDTNYKEFPLAMKSELNQVIQNNNLLFMLNNNHTYDNKVIPYYGTNKELATPFIDLGIRDLIKEQWSKIKTYSELEKNDSLYFGENDGVVPEISGKGEGLFSNSQKFENYDHIGWVAGGSAFENLYLSVFNNLSSDSTPPSCTTPPGKVTGLTCSYDKSTKKMYTSWSAPSSCCSITKYIIEINDGSGSKTYDEKTTSRVFTMQADARFCLRVKAVNCNGEGTFSDECCCGEKPPCIPTKPNKPVITYDKTKKILKVCWQPSTVPKGCCRVTNYFIGYMMNGSKEKFIDNKDKLCYEFVNVEVNTKLKIRVLAKDCNKIPSLWSDTADYPPLPCKDLPLKPSKPKLTVDCAKKMLKVCWQPSTVPSGCCGITNYNVWYSVNGKEKPVINNMTNICKDFSGVKYKDVYCVKVQAKNCNGLSAWSESTCFTVSCSEPTKDVPSTPGKPVASMDCTTKTISFSWQGSAVPSGVCGVTNYLVGYLANGTEKIFDAKSSTTIKWDNAPNGTTYCVRVKARNCNGDSAWSESTCFTVDCKEKPVDSMAIPYWPLDGSTVYSDKPTLKWNCEMPPANLKGYEIKVYPTQDCNDSNYTDEVITTNKFWEPTRIVYGRMYYWKVRCVTNDSPPRYGKWSKVYSFKTEVKPAQKIITKASVLYAQNTYSGELPLYDSCFYMNFGFFGFEVNEECLISIEVYQGDKKEDVMDNKYNPKKAPFWNINRHRIYPNPKGIFDGTLYNTITPSPALPIGNYWWRYKAISNSNREEDWTWISVSGPHFMLLNYIPEPVRCTWDTRPFGSKYEISSIPVDINNQSFKNAKTDWSVDVGTLEPFPGNLQLDFPFFYVPSGNDYYATFTCYVEYRGRRYGPFTYKLKVGNPPTNMNPEKMSSYAQGLFTNKQRMFEPLAL